MLDKEKLAELLNDNLNCIEFSDDTLKSFQELAKEFGYCNLAKALKSAKIKWVFAPDANFFNELRNSLERLQGEEIPKLNYVCTVNGGTYRYDIFTNYLCSDPFIKLDSFHLALNKELATSKLFQPIEWKNFISLIEKKFTAHLYGIPDFFARSYDYSTRFVIHVADAKDFLDTFLPACFDREHILPQKIIDTCNSPFVRPAIQISNLETLWVIPANEPQRNIDICKADDKLVVCLNDINAWLAKVNLAPFSPLLRKAAIKKNIFKSGYYYYCELGDVDDILADIGGDVANQLRRIFSCAEIACVKTTKCTIDLEE